MEYTNTFCKSIWLLNRDLCNTGLLSIFTTLIAVHFRYCNFLSGRGILVGVMLVKELGEGGNMPILDSKGWMKLYNEIFASFEKRGCLVEDSMTETRKGDSSKTIYSHWHLHAFALRSQTPCSNTS